jgi:hypothetical protein
MIMTPAGHAGGRRLRDRVNLRTGGPISPTANSLIKIKRQKDDPITNTTPEDAVILEEMFVQIARTVTSDRRR